MAATAAAASPIGPDMLSQGLQFREPSRKKRRGSLSHKVHLIPVWPTMQADMLWPPRQTPCVAHRSGATFASDMAWSSTQSRRCQYSCSSPTSGHTSPLLLHSTPTGHGTQLDSPLPVSEEMPT